MGPEFGHILDSLGWAIVHSLWQGTLAAIAVIAFRNITRDSQASARYGFQVICLAACLAAFIITFSLYQMKAYTVPVSAAPSASPFVTITALLTETRAALPTGADISLSRILTLAAPILGLLWCLGFALLAARYFCAYLITQKLRSTGISPVPQGWETRFQTLVLNAGIRRHVEFFISNRIKGPLTLGFFKPVVLVPASFFTGLPSEQAEAILLHEIAHIRRHDYLVNLLQTVIKTVFFFHPAVQFVSRRIDHDREHACDDFAVAFTRDPQALARGLAALRLETMPHAFALAADNGNTPLLARLKRLGSINDTRRRPEHVMTSVATLILAAGLYVSTSPLAGAQPTEKPADIAAHPSGEKGNYTFAKQTEAGRTFTVKIAPDGSRWINVDGRWFDIAKHPEMIAKIPDMPQPPTPPSSEDYRSNASQYKVDLDYYNAGLQYAGGGSGDPDLAGAASQTRTSASQDEKVRARIEREIEKEMAKSEREKHNAWKRAEIDRDRIEAQTEHQRERILSQAEAQREAAIERAEAQHEAAVERAEQQRGQAIERAEEQMERAQEQLEQLEEQREQAMEAREEAMERAEEAMERAEQSREKAERHAEKMRKKHAKSYKSFSKALMIQLKKDGLVDVNAGSVTITYPNKHMAVNGKPVPRDLEGRYCDILDAYDVTKTENTRIKIQRRKIKPSRS